MSFKSALLALAIVLTFVISWELYIRHKGVVLDYDDGPELWSNNRAMVYEPADKATVFIGSLNSIWTSRPGKRLPATMPYKWLWWDLIRNQYCMTLQATQILREN